MKKSLEKAAGGTAKKKVSNREVAAIFYRIADILEIQGVEWKPRAYRAAANAIESMAKPLQRAYEEGGLKALDQVPGVGKHISKKIEELLKTGKLEYYEKLKSGFPVKLDELDEIPGLGPKKIAVLYKKLNVTDLKSLKEAAESGKISSLPGFAEKSGQEILKAVSGKPFKSRRTPLAVAKPIAKDIVARVCSLKETVKAEAAGSLRRKRPTVGDLDILVASWKPEKITKAFVSMPLVKKVLVSGKTKSSVVLKNGLQVDLRVVEPGQWGSALQYFTGSKSHSIALRKIAIKKGLKLSEYGVFRGGRLVAGKTEKEVYNALGLEYVKPEERENEGEIEEAIKRFKR